MKCINICLYDSFTQVASSSLTFCALTTFGDDNWLRIALNTGVNTLSFESRSKKCLKNASQYACVCMHCVQCTTCEIMWDIYNNDIRLYGQGGQESNNKSVSTKRRSWSLLKYMRSFSNISVYLSLRCPILSCLSLFSLILLLHIIYDQYRAISGTSL